MKEFAWHLTPASNLPDIMAEGLRPNLSEVGGGMGETVPRVFLFRDADALLSGMDWMLDRFEEDEALALLLVNLHGLEIEECGEVANFEIAVRETIPPSALCVAHRNFAGLS